MLIFRSKSLPLNFSFVISLLKNEFVSLPWRLDFDVNCFDPTCQVHTYYTTFDILLPTRRRINVIDGWHQPTNCLWERQVHHNFQSA